MNKMEPTERIKEIFETTCDSDFKYSGNIAEIDCYSLLCKATAMNKLYRLLGCNVLMITT